MRSTYVVILLVILFGSVGYGAVEKVPENAADLYREAIELYQPELEPVEAIYDLISGENADYRAVEEHIKANRKVIDIALEASKIENCDWGFKPIAFDPDDPNEFANELERQTDIQMEMRRIAFLFLADAKIHAHRSEIEKAIDGVMTGYAVSRDIFSDSMIGYLTIIGLEPRIDNILTEILSEHRLNVMRLNGIKLRLKQHKKSRQSVKNVFDFETQYGLASIDNVTEDLVKEQASFLFRIGTGDPNFIEILKSDYVKYSDIDRNYYLKHRQKLRETMDMPYSKAIAAIDKMSDVIVNDAIVIGQDGHDVSVNSTALMTQVAASPSLWGKCYTLHVRTVTRFNALLAAIEIYKIKAKTGKLPAKLPLGCPKDLFSGEGFVYERTADGFLLRCRGKDLSKDKFHEWEFGVGG